MKEKHIGIKGIEIAVRMDEQRAKQIGQSWPYQRVVAPTLRWFHRRQHRASLNGNTAPGAMPICFPRPSTLQADRPEYASLIEDARALEWYHSIEIAPGQWTPGCFDHAPAIPHYHFPASLAGKRCLDVATADGFWAFEMERRGAAEVVGLDVANWLDLDVPEYRLAELRTRQFSGGNGAGFRLAAGAVGSNVQRTICNVYDLSPERLGQFDLVFSGDLMLHITNPLHALQNICRVTRHQAIIVEPYLPMLDAAGSGPIARLLGSLDDYTWWEFSRSFLERAIRLAGFKRVELVDEIDLRFRPAPEIPMPRAIFHAFN